MTLRSRIRTLHAPEVSTSYDMALSLCCGCICYDGDSSTWPCETASLVYTPREIEQQKDRAEAALDALRAERFARASSRADILALAVYNPSPGLEVWMAGHPRPHHDGVCLCEETDDAVLPPS